MWQVWVNSRSRFSQRTAEIVFSELMGALIDQANSNPYDEGLEGDSVK